MEPFELLARGEAHLLSRSCRRLLIFEVRVVVVLRRRVVAVFIVLRVGLVRAEHTLDRHGGC
jgi:hypothetical protein